jgi:hypothetical protein
MVKRSSSSVVHDSSPEKFPITSITLTFESWSDIANKCGISRIYGGIHGNNANHTGLIIGNIIGADILKR